MMGLLGGGQASKIGQRIGKTTSSGRASTISLIPSEWSMSKIRVWAFAMAVCMAIA
jgi:hypothetical protein